MSTLPLSFLLLLAALGGCSALADFEGYRFELDASDGATVPELDASDGATVPELDASDGATVPELDAGAACCGLGCESSCAAWWCPAGFGRYYCRTSSPCPFPAVCQ
jgi:hypothetical protein